MPPILPSRRSFLAGSAAAAAATALPAATRPGHAGRSILILGGTGFLGPAVVAAALAKGHRVTLWNRGRTNPGLFPEVEKLQGQRRRPRPDHPTDPAQDLTALRNRKFDACVDTSGYYKGEVEDVANLLADQVGQYLFISSLSVYRSLEQDATPVDEQSELCTCDDPYTQDMGANYERYGALKRYGEDAVTAAFGARATVLRPGYIVGPGDPTDRFSYWPARLRRGGDILAPGSMANELQFVDVRDLGEWIVQLIEQQVSGNFNAVGFDGRISTAEFLHTGKGTLNHQCRFTWVDDEFLLQHAVSPWQELGCWTPAKQNGRASNQKALAAGARYRPIAETLRDTAAWIEQERGNRPWRAGMKPEREAELLATFRKR